MLTIQPYSCHFLNMMILIIGVISMHGLLHSSIVVSIFMSTAIVFIQPRFLHAMKTLAP